MINSSQTNLSHSVTAFELYGCVWLGLDCIGARAAAYCRRLRQHIPPRKRCIKRAYIVESYSNLEPLRYPASVTHKTRTRGVSVYGCGLAITRKPRKLRDEFSDP